MQQVSIITINYNNASGLAATIQSVQEQDYKEVEYIIIDGGSTDDSVQQVKNLAVPPAYFVSEKDKGIYHAMNKGIAKANGEYLLFLNSGDRLINQYILSEVFSVKQQAGILFGNLQTSKGEIRYPTHPDFMFFFRDSIGHPASFIQKKLFDNFGLYNESNKIVSDWEFFLKLIFKEKVSIAPLYKVISYYDLNGMSNSQSNIQMQLAERAAVLKEYLPEYYPQLLEQINRQQNELNNYKNSRAIGLLQRLMNSAVYKAFTPKK